MARVHLIHGFNVSDGGEKSVLRLKLYFELAGYEVVAHNYGWVGPILLRWHNELTVKEIRYLIEPGDILVGHSNGALICWELVDMGAEPSAVVCIQPAMRRDTLWPEDLPVLCLYNESDYAVIFGRMWGRFVSVVRPWVNGHGWGAAGRHGFTAGQPLVINVNTCVEPICVLDACGHSKIFRGERIEYWGPYITKWVRMYRREDIGNSTCFAFS